ncbi:hypothetical protein VTH82DRAFT_3884 [Thermothelomyces myriococcoides]
MFKAVKKMSQDVAERSTEEWIIQSSSGSSRRSSTQLKATVAAISLGHTTAAPGANMDGTERNGQWPGGIVAICLEKESAW